MLQQVGTDIWIVEGGPIDGIAGFHFPTRMIVIRLPRQRLFLWSPIAMDAALKQAIADLGIVHHIVAPGTFHHSYLAQWADAFPDALVHLAPGLVNGATLPSLDSTLGETPHSDWHSTIEQVVFDQCRMMTEVVFFHRPSGTVIFTDLLQQLPKDWFTGWRRLIARLDGMTGDVPQVPRKFRVSIRNRSEARKQIGRVLDWPAQQIACAHAPIVRKDAPTVLRAAFRWLNV